MIPQEEVTHKAKIEHAQRAKKANEEHAKAFRAYQKAQEALKNAKEGKETNDAKKALTVSEEALDAAKVEKAVWHSLFPQGEKTHSEFDPMVFDSRESVLQHWEETLTHLETAYFRIADMLTGRASMQAVSQLSRPDFDEFFDTLKKRAIDLGYQLRLVSNDGRMYITYKDLDVIPSDERDELPISKKKKVDSMFLLMVEAYPAKPTATEPEKKREKTAVSSFSL